MDSICWMVAFIVLLAIEVITLGLTTIWFALGAIAAFISTLFGAGYVVQGALFIVVSIVTLIATRPIAVKYFSKNLTKTNVEEIIGKTAVITKRIADANSYGEAKVEGDTWMARSYDGMAFEEGEEAKIVSVEGVKLVLGRK